MKDKNQQHILALSGGVGGAKLVEGLQACLPAEDLSIVVNTADDFQHLGLKICPDIDTILYTLSGNNDKLRGWGRADESWRCMETLKTLGGPDWFQLGDLDLATHLLRTDKLNQGSSLTQVTRLLADALDIKAHVFPMSDDNVKTKLLTSTGLLDFQQYFVANQCKPKVSAIHFEQIDKATLQPQVEEILLSDDLRAIIICPSNPYVSVDPILHIPKFKSLLKSNRAPVIAISPIINGESIKGPTSKLMNEFNLPVNQQTIAMHYAGIIDGLVVDHKDAEAKPSLEEQGLNVLVTSTLMDNIETKQALAAQVLEFADCITGSTD